MLLHCSHIVVIFIGTCCYIAVTYLLHCCHIVVTLLLHCHCIAVTAVQCHIAVMSLSFCMPLGASTALENQQGKTAYSLARNPETAAMLKQAGVCDVVWGCVVYSCMVLYGTV